MLKHNIDVDVTMGIRERDPRHTRVDSRRRNCWLAERSEVDWDFYVFVYNPAKRLSSERENTRIDGIVEVISFVW